MAKQTEFVGKNNVNVALEVNNQIDGLLAGKSFDEVVAEGGR